MADDELVEVLDDAGAVTGVVTRREMRERRLRHRVVFVVVLTGDDEVVVHRRSEAKDVFGGLWDLAFGGVVGAGEGWDEAAARELAEEAGVTVPLQLLATGRWEGPEGREDARIYLGRSDGPFTFVDGEVTETALVARAGLADWLAGHAVCPDSRDLVVPVLASLAGGRP